MDDLSEAGHAMKTVQYVDWWGGPIWRVMYADDGEPMSMFFDATEKDAFVVWKSTKWEPLLDEEFLFQILQYIAANR